MPTRAFTLFVCFLLATTLIARASQFEPRPIRASLATFPMELGAWRGRVAPPFDDRTLAVLGADDYLTRAYLGAQSIAGLYIAYWASQRQGDAIHSPLNCLPGAGWEPLSAARLNVDVEDRATGATRPITINRYVVQKGLDRQLVLYWYQSHGRIVASEYLSKVYLVTDAIRLHRTDAAIVRVTIPIRDQADSDLEAERNGVQFIKTMFPLLDEYLPS